MCTGNKDVNGLNQVYDYTNANENSIRIEKSSSLGEMCFDTEDMFIEEIVVEREEYVYVQNESYSSITWTKNDYVYRVRGNLSKDEIIKIAKNIK